MLRNEQAEKVLARVKKLIPEASDDEPLLVQLIADAADYVEEYTGRTATPDILLRIVGDLAIIDYNRRGTEGEKARSEGGESYTFEEAPARIIKVLDSWRLARVGGERHEATEEDEG